MNRIRGLSVLAVIACFSEISIARSVTGFGLGACVPDAALSCCTGGIGSVPLQCNCMFDWEMTGIEIGTNSNQLQAINEWNPLGSPAVGGNTNPHGACYSSNEVSFIPCEASTCLAMTAQAGDANTPCPTLYDASTYLAANGMTMPDNTMQNAIIQSVSTFTGPFTIEAREALPTGNGMWANVMNTYVAPDAGMNCQLPDQLYTFWAPNNSCQFNVGVYTEIDFCERQGPTANFDNGIWSQNCNQSSDNNQFFFGSPPNDHGAGFHIYTMRVTVQPDGGAGSLIYYVDGTLVNQFDSFSTSNTGTVHGCGPQGTVPIEPQYLLWNSTIGGNGGPYDAAGVQGQPGLYQQLTDWVRVTSP